MSAPDVLAEGEWTAQAWRDAQETLRADGDDGYDVGNAARVHASAVIVLVAEVQRLTERDAMLRVFAAEMASVLPDAEAALRGAMVHEHDARGELATMRSPSNLARATALNCVRWLASQADSAPTSPAAITDTMRLDEARAALIAFADAAAQVAK